MTAGRRADLGWLAAAALALVLAGCDNGVTVLVLDAEVAEVADPGVDAVPDASETAERGDAPAGETTTDLPAEPGDTVDAPDAADLPETADVPDAACPAAPTPPAPDTTATKYALSMFHFNIQYVAGGMITEYNGQQITLCGLMTGDDTPCLGWTDDKLNDWIIDITFKPAMDLYQKHPTWHVTFEMPGLMLEIMAARHGAVLAQLQDMIAAGQAEVISFHYSDQFFLAFPERDMERSYALTRDVFQKSCVPLSGAVFNQEGQSGMGKHAFMATHGYSIDVTNANQLGYTHSTTPIWPLYTDGATDVVVGGASSGVDPASGLTVQWSYFDDGELLAVPADPYFATANPAPDPYSIPAYEQKVQALETAGFKIATVSEYVADLKARGFQAQALPTILDGTWHPQNTENVHQWMGRRGTIGLYSPAERDGWMRADNYKVSRDLAAVEVLRDAAQQAGKAVDDVADGIDTAWHDLLRAEVSDATGINSWQGELMYGVNNDIAAETALQAVRATLLGRLGWTHASVDLAAGTATSIDAVPAETVGTLVDQPTPPVQVTVTANTRQITTAWHKLADGSADVVDITVGPGGDPTAVDVTKCQVSASFPRTEDVIRYTPALQEATVTELPFSTFSFDGTEIWLPLSNGLIGLGNNLWLIKDCRASHVAAGVTVDPTAPAQVVEFVDETADPAGTHWRFWVVTGTADAALAMANRVNITPVVAF
jgi:hypothetical protein